MAKIWADKDGKLLRFLRTDAEMAFITDTPVGSVLFMEFDTDQNADLCKRIYDNWTDISISTRHKNPILVHDGEELQVEKYKGSKATSNSISAKINELIAWANKNGASIDPFI